MNAQFDVAILRTHSEYVSQLVTELTTTLRALEQSLNAQSPYSAIPASGQAERLAELQRLLTTEADALCRRLQGFLEQTSQRSTGECSLPQEAESIPLQKEDGAQPHVEGAVRPQSPTSLI